MTHPAPAVYRPFPPFAEWVGVAVGVSTLDVDGMVADLDRRAARASLQEKGRL